VSTTLEQIQSFYLAFKRASIFIFICSSIAGGIAFFIIRSEKGVYDTYSKIFPLSINKGGGSSPIDAIKSQFGISDKTDLDKMYNVKELVTSRRISRNIVSQNPNHVNYKTFAQWLIADYNSNLSFLKRNEKLNPKTKDDSIYTGASLLVNTTSVETEAKGGFTTIRTSAHEQELCKKLNETILSEISKFYITFSTEKAQTDLVKIKSLRDSLKGQLYGLENSIAGAQDATRFSVRSTVNIPQARLMRNRQEIEQLYTVAASAYQNANFKLLNESPIFQVLDYPGPPYNFTQPSAKRAAMVYFLATFVLLSLVACRKVFWNMIKEELSRA
jgi:hypothetical protein